MSAQSCLLSKKGTFPQLYSWCYSKIQGLLKNIMSFVKTYLLIFTQCTHWIWSDCYKYNMCVFSTYFHTENTVRNITKLDQIEQFELSKKAAVVSNFWLIGKIPHNFLVPKMIESACKTFMPIQTLDLHRVATRNPSHHNFYGPICTVYCDV